MNVGALTGAEVTLLATELSEEMAEAEAETERETLPEGADTESVGTAETEETAETDENETEAADDDDTGSAELRFETVLAAADETALDEGAATATVTSKRL